MFILKVNLLLQMLNSQIMMVFTRTPSLDRRSQPEILFDRGFPLHEPRSKGRPGHLHVMVVCLQSVV